MSEIFSWLKRAENERRKDLPEILNESEGQDHGIISDEPAAEARSAAVPLTVTRGPLPSASTFDLRSASDLVRIVLEPKTVVGEKFRLLRAKLSLAQKDHGLKTLLVTSAVAGEGKTYTACCLAGVLAQEPGKRVALVEADLRKPNLLQYFGKNGVHDHQGLSEVLRGTAKVEDTFVKCNDADFYIVSAGQVPDNPSELLSSPSLEATLRSLADAFDWIVVDSPPIFALADTSLLAPVCDATLLVVAANRTPAKVINESIHRIGRENFCGLMVNRVRRLKDSGYYQKKSDLRRLHSN